MSGKQFRNQRLRSKKAFEQDSKTKSCSRPSCSDKRGCFTARKAKYMEKKNLYTQLKCPNEKVPRGKSSLLTGKIYDLGGLTAKFNSPGNRPIILLDGNRYSTMGTIHDGRSRHKLLMTQEPIEDNTKPGKSNSISSLRISGFGYTII